MRGLLLGAVGLVVALALIGGMAYATTDVRAPRPESRAQVSVVEWSDGSELARLGEVHRQDVPLARVSEAARHAVLAAEDRDFYRTPGVSPKAVLRAAVANVRGGEVRQGGSTITQQYVKNAHLTQERTVSRKVQEALLALKLDRTYGKERILESYLNTVYFGRGAHGIEVAARTWFGTTAAELTAAQGAVLAAALASPSRYDPEGEPAAARARWTWVLQGMAEQGWLAEGVAAQEYPEVLPRRRRSEDLVGPQGYLVQQVKDELAALGIAEGRAGASGLRIRTTFDRSAQAEAVAAVQGVTGATAPAGVRRALVAVEPGTGRVRASYGGDDFVTRPFDDAVQGTAQAGSSFKPYVLAAALDRGLSLRTTFDGSSPQRFGDYRVRNFGGGSFGQVDLVDATAHSVNTVYVPLGQRVGLDRVIDTAQRLGITADMSGDREFPSLSLGVTSVRPIDQAVAYATLAARGLHAAPFVVEQVRDAQGRELHTADPQPRRVLPEGVADDTSYALQQVVERGTGRRAALPARPAAGKTGTTNGNTAAWFVGYTPQLSVAVALYSDDREVPLRNLSGVREVTGGTLPAQVWQRFVTAVLRDVPVELFVPPSLPPAPSPEPS